jgi:predicted porin
LAAVSGTAFAQSTVTLSGTLQIGAINNGKTATQAAGATATSNVKTSSTAAHNTWATSTLNINAVEDLGGGLKASAVMISSVGGGFAERQRTLGLSGGFGSVTFGRFVPAAAAGFHGFSGAGSANLAGSIYSMSTAGTTATTHGDAANFERQDNVLQYTSPSFGGITANLAIANNSSDSDASNMLGKTEGKQTSLHLGYAAGPLSVGFGTNSRTDTVEATTAPVPTKSNLQWIGASYKLGFGTVSVTNVTRDAKAAGAKSTDASVTSFGISAPLGAITLGASAYSGTDKRATGTADDMKLSGNQLSVSYALSKRTTLVAATGTNQIKRDGAASTAATRKVTGTTLGLTHTF